MNKRLAYFEAQCSPNGKPIKLADGSVGIRQSQMKEYTYLWKTRCRFLEAIYDMNHDRRLNENWQCEKVHGYVHRTYKRYGHDLAQRRAYWRDEIDAGRIPYDTPGIAEMGT